MKIAIVGAGVSGLVAAHLLHPEHEIAVFEAGAYAGGHTNTVRVDTEHATHHVDTGFIVFNDRNYPNFERLLTQLRVPSQPSTMSFGVSDGGDFEYCGASPNGLFAKRGHLVTPWFHRMMADLVRFNRDARALLRAGGDGPSLGHWLHERRYSRPFVERLIVPQASAVWSADPAQMWTFPARFLVEFFDNHGVLGFRDRPQWRTVRGGSRTYVEAIVCPWRDRLRLDTPVRAIRRCDDHVTVTPAGGTYDKLVSIEMIEAVGWKDFGTFFERCARLLRPDGVMALQAITIDDRLYDVEKASRTFIRSHIFPNGCLPSLEVIARSVARRSDLRMVDLEDITPHYAETLRRWRANVESAGARLAELGYDERFQRLWRLYLCFCEAGFAERRISNVQVVLAKPRWRGHLAVAEAPAQPSLVAAARVAVE
jgi:hypothetical protein